MDRATFDRLLLEQLPAAQRFAIRLTGDANDAEDLVHDALLRIARRWMTYRRESSIRTWLFQVIVNAFRDRLRSSRARSEIATAGPLAEATVDPRAAEPSRDAEGRELGDLVAGAIATLPPRQREVLVLSVYEQLSAAEIAAVLDLTEQNVRTTLHLARERLRARLAKYLDVNSDVNSEQRP